MAVLQVWIKKKKVLITSMIFLACTHHFPLFDFNSLPRYKSQTGMCLYAGVLRADAQRSASAAHFFW